MSNNDIIFIHHKPRVFNLGDFLCTPKHYFQFQVKTGCGCSSKNEQKIVYGGGAQTQFGIREGLPKEQTIAWGIGSSIHGENANPPIAEDLPYFLYGIRDPDSVTDEKHVLPCVSCLHPLVEIPPGNQTNIFLNKDSHITNLNLFSRDAVFENKGIKIYLNSMREASFIKAFSKSGRIITNSYHVTYWSLLSGREVAVLGYSSKFRSLLKLLGFSESCLNYYDVESKDSLKEIILDIIQREAFLKLDHFKDIRDSFIKKNYDFAQLCVEKKFFSGYSIKRHTASKILQRNWAYYVYLIFYFLKKDFAHLIQRFNKFRWKRQIALSNFIKTRFGKK